MPIHLDASFIGRKSGNQIFEAQRQNNGIIVLANLQKKLEDGGFTVSADPDVVFALSVDSFPLPKTSNNVIELPYQNQRIKVAGAMVFDDMDVVLKDFIDVDTAKMLTQWRLLVANPANGAVGLAYQYKVDNILAIIYGPDGSYTRYYKMDGVWPSRLDSGDIDESSDDYLRVTVTLTCDRIIPLLALNNDGTKMPTFGAGSKKQVGGVISLYP
jgi:hypothetical protein